MKLISINVGLPREVNWKDRLVTTGIFKAPIAGRVMARRLNLDGDRQADLTVHGGAEKAIYAYPAEHYPFWRDELPEMKLDWGMFGENFTVEGLHEESLNIGDQLRIGAAVVMVTQPRMPCYKLGVKFGRDDILKRFLQSRRSGFYFSVVEEGEVEAGDAIEFISRDPHAITVADITELYANKNASRDLLRRAAGVEALPSVWRDYFLERLEK